MMYMYDNFKIQVSMKVTTVNKITCTSDNLKNDGIFVPPRLMNSIQHKNFRILEFFVAYLARKMMLSPERNPTFASQTQKRTHLATASYTHAR